jgi:hypothetical protein
MNDSLDQLRKSINWLPDLPMHLPSADSRPARDQ